MVTRAPTDVGKLKYALVTLLEEDGSTYNDIDIFRSLATLVYWDLRMTSLASLKQTSAHSLCLDLLPQTHKSLSQLERDAS